MKIAQSVKGISLVDIAKGVKEGKENAVNFPIDRERYVRSFTSCILKRDFPERKYKVARAGKVIQVYWERRIA